jgi:hypothetical protein
MPYDHKAYMKKYNRMRYRLFKEKIKAKAREDYHKIKNDPGFKKKLKLRRELLHFGVPRSVIMKKTKGRCIRCEKKAQIIHHLDGDGRTNERKGKVPGRNPERLVPMCRSCHMKEHWKELFEARASDQYHCGKGKRRKSPACSL